MKRPLLIFAICELAYLAAARTFTHNYTGGAVPRELWWTVIRFVSAVVMLWLFRKSFAAEPGETRKFTPSCLLAAGMFLAPLLTGYHGLDSPLRYVFVATSVVIGLREEVAYRAILQTQLRRHFGFLPALIFSNILFVLYHYGAQAFTVLNVWQMFAAGAIIGLAYEASGSLLLAVVLHAIYDALWVFPPVLQPPLPDIFGSGVLAAVILALLAIRRAKLQLPTSSSSQP